MFGRYFGTREQLGEIHERLKLTPCPHCKQVGALNRHGHLRGYDENNQRQRAVRGHRVYCNNRKLAPGCGRTFSVWTAGAIRRLCLTASGLWKYLKRASATGNKLQALRSVTSELADSAPYRIWKRFQRAQSAIRAALVPRCPPPKIPSDQPADQTIAHLEAAFGVEQPIRDFQLTLQTSFL